MNTNEKKKLREMANAIRALSIDAIEKANSGHPGMPLGMADVATILFKNHMKFDPQDPHWINRDRFVLSAGHGSMLLYALSYLVGYKDCTLNQIKKFRQLGSKTAGHPEFGLLKSIETTTGPLGQGFANSVGMALAEKILNLKFGNVFDHKTWCIVGDGCLMEGISQESISFAGHHRLNKLIVLFDNNKISIDGSVNLTCSDDQEKRFKASNWNTITINGHDFDEIDNALKKVKNSKKPTLISCKTLIGFGSPNKAGTESCHGSPLGINEVALTKKNLNWPHKSFFIPEKIIKEWKNIGQRGHSINKRWQSKFQKSSKNKEILRQMKSKKFIRTNETLIFLNEIVKKSKAEATRKSSQNSLEYISKKVINLLGGSADLTGSNLTKTSSSNSKGKNLNYIHYGVREHLMSAAMNGIAVHGGLIPYGGTFLVFSDYCKNSIRLSAMMKQRVIYVFTHDSIGLGEDGPTHQPIEHLAGLRSIPNLNVFRPCDAIETFESWEIAINSLKTPSVLALSRQNLPQLRKKFKNNLASRGGYLLRKSEKSKLTLIASGSEVSIGLDLHDKLKKNGISSNLVSMPCIEIFEQQKKLYKENVLGTRFKVVIEAASSHGWHKFLSSNDLVFGIDEFGESGKGNDLYEHFSLTKEIIYKKIINQFFK